MDAEDRFDQEGGTMQEPTDMGYWREDGKHIVELTAGKYDISKALVCDFKLTRDELWVLAKWYMDGIRDNEMEWKQFAQVTGRRPSFERMACRRLYAIREAMGQKDFEAAIEEIDHDWQRRFAEYEKDRQSCEYNEDPKHPHGYCEDNIPKIKQLEQKWPHLTKKQIGCLLRFEPFIGMTIDQAQEIVTPHYSRKVIKNGSQEQWELTYRLWVPNEGQELNVWENCSFVLREVIDSVLRFVDGRLVGVDRPRRTNVSPEPNPSADR